MTKERKLAIELWQAMRKKVSDGEIADVLDMALAKRNWLEAHNIVWYHDCWFCNYFRQDIDDNFDDDEEETTYKTSKCPLNRYRPSRCEGSCRQYTIACNRRYPLEQRLAAVDNIIKALKGEYKEEQE